MFTDVSVDLETLATTCDAAILSIGAVKFDLINDRIDDSGFYASVSVQSNVDYGRLIDEGTLRWWMDQSEHARRVFTEPKQGLDDALEALTDWFYDHETESLGQSMIAKERRIWTNGANFDEPMLAHAYYHARMVVPWKFWNVRCVRSWKTLPGAKDISVPRVGTHHNALGDAITQARLMQAVYKKLFQR